MKKAISITLVIIWMIIVFLFSSQIGDDSQVTSGNTIRKIIKNRNKNYLEQFFHGNAIIKHFEALSCF